jgi:DNA repair exonuclease SbcCD ATPase subunit
MVAKSHISEKVVEQAAEFEGLVRKLAADNAGNIAREKEIEAQLAKVRSKLTSYKAELAELISRFEPVIGAFAGESNVGRIIGSVSISTRNATKNARSKVSGSRVSVATADKVKAFWKLVEETFSKESSVLLKKEFIPAFKKLVQDTHQKSVDVQAIGYFKPIGLIAGKHYSATKGPDGGTTLDLTEIRKDRKLSRPSE